MLNLTDKRLASQPKEKYVYTNHFVDSFCLYLLRFEAFVEIKSSFLIKHVIIVLLEKITQSTRDDRDCIRISCF